MLTQRIKITSPTINVMAMAAMKAARALLRDFGEVEQLQVSRKGPGDFVSAADHRAEKTIRQELTKARKNYSLLMEESGLIEGEDKDYRWIVDPLDGTTNFLHGLPHFAIAIALEYRNEIVSGVVFDPVKDEMFYAAKGMGMYVDDRRLRVSARRDLGTALLGLGYPHAGSNRSGELSKLFRNYETLNGKVAGMRRSGSAALDLSYLAAGRLDAYIATDLAPWDLAAGTLFVKEAGGHICDFNKQDKMMENGTIIASNIELHHLFVKAIKNSV